MIARKLVCLLLAAIFALATVPVTLAGDTPPPGIDDHSIHPWDNNDGYGATGGPAEVSTRPVIFFWFGQTGQVFWVTLQRVERSAEKNTASRTLTRQNRNRSTESQAFGR